MIDSLEQISRNSYEDEEEDEDEDDDVYISSKKKFNPMIALDILPKLMETTLVNVLSNQLYASDIAIDCYCNFHRWLIYFVQKFPQLVGGFVNSTIEKFIESDKYRDKKVFFLFLFVFFLFIYFSNFFFLFFFIISFIYLFRLLLFYSLFNIFSYYYYYYYY